MEETDGLSVLDSALAREPTDNTAHMFSTGYSQLRSENQPRIMAIKHPEYTARSARLASYHSFARHMEQHPADMTDAGFYYAGFGDSCRCFHCGIGLRNWDPEDNPWIEHARWSAECPYIRKIKGQAFIDLVQEAARAAEMADRDEDNEADNEGASTQSKSAINEKSGANNSVQKASAGNSSYEVENIVAKMIEAEISNGMSADGGNIAELASILTNIMVETDCHSVSDSASARELTDNTAHVSSAGYSQLQSESPLRVMAIKHPEYTARSVRLGSYYFFPRHTKQHPADMTDAGLYYAGLRNWEPEDNPWIEHARWSAECPYILKMKGQAFINSVQEATKSSAMADRDEDNEADNESVSGRFS
uniref:Apoptosis inhibitor IAP n=1 Tax=Magallana gigas TaxID=29159 RepID=K1PZ94_MAGGI